MSGVGKQKSVRVFNGWPIVLSERLTDLYTCHLLLQVSTDNEQ